MARQHQSPRKVLLVEDEALVAMVVADRLVELGFDVVEAATAREALDHADDGITTGTDWSCPRMMRER